MRRIPTLILMTATLAVLASTASASEREALAAIDRAIKAQGGASALAKAISYSRTDTGTRFLPEKDLKFTSDVVCDLPQRVKLAFKADGVDTVIVLNGDKGYVRSGGTVSEMPEKFRREVREEVYVNWLVMLVPLTKGGVTLSTLSHVKVDGEDAIPVRVARKGYLDATLYFSKRTDLLLKITRRVPEAGVLTDREYFFSDYKTFDGVKLPGKERMTSNGRRIQEYTVSNYRFLRSIEPSTFGRP